MKKQINIYKKILHDFIGFLPTVSICIASMLFFIWRYGKVCLLRIVFGIPCPACGMTRALVLLATGHIKESIYMHPGALLLIIGIISYIYEKYIYREGEKSDAGLESLAFTKWYTIFCLIFIIVLYIIRIRLLFPDIAPLQYDGDNFLFKILRRN